MKEKIRQQALSMGFSVCHFGQAVDKTTELKQWLAQNYHGEMEWMTREPEVRGNGQVLMPGMRSTIVVGLNYGPGYNPLGEMADLTQGYISVYARGDDYHDVLKKRLKAFGSWLAQEYGCSLKVFVDTAPVMEKPLVQQAGLGWQGKHTCVVSKHYGSWLFLGVIFTTLEISQDTPETNHCGSCKACQTTCPTSAFVQPYLLDARKCISYLTIEHKGPVAEELRPKLGSRIYGCDDCLASCPWNKFAKQATEQKFHARVNYADYTLRELAQLDDAAFRTLFSKSPIKRIGRNRFVRNVLYAIGNSAEPSLLDVVQPLLADPDPVVQDAARWAQQRLSTHNVG